MLNISKKYIVLVFINILALIVLFSYSNNTLFGEVDPISTEDIIAMQVKSETLAEEVSLLEQQIASNKDLIASTKTQLDESQVLLGQSEQKYDMCEVDKLTALKEAKGQVRALKNQSANSANSCDAEQDELLLAKAKIIELENELGIVREKLALALEDASNKNSQLSRIQSRDEGVIAALRLENEKLVKALNEPIAIESNYISAHFCEKPKYDSLICAKELLVRPNFTKTPITKLSIKLFDRNETLVAKGEFNAAQAQLFRFTMGRYGKELPAGPFKVEYVVDNQTLVSEVMEITQ